MPRLPAWPWSSHLPYAANLRMFALITLPLWLALVLYAARNT
jgi:hypothetical protein